MTEIKHWSEDRYWTEALEKLSRLRKEGCTTLTLDLGSIDKIAYNGDGPAYRLLDAMMSVREHESMDGYRGAPRVMLALLIRLEELSQLESSASPLCSLVDVAPRGAKLRKWTLRQDDHGHHHDIVRLSESPLYLELSWRPTKKAPAHRVGLFRLELGGLLDAGYVRHEPVDAEGSELRLRIVRTDNGEFYIQSREDAPRLLVPVSDKDSAACS